jgi:hypothetical protein
VSLSYHVVFFPQRLELLLKSLSILLVSRIPLPATFIVPPVVNIVLLVGDIPT